MASSETALRPFEWLTSPQSLKPLIESLDLPTERSALHVGCGSSIVGELLVESMGFDYCLNIDRDQETLDRMKQRWNDKCSTTPDQLEMIEYQHVDFLKRDTSLDRRFELVLDKSTLDCTLCSKDASTGLLCLVDRHLEIGGFYVVISFHQVDLLLPLLQNCPGTQWTVTRETMTRHVEDLIVGSGSNNHSIVDVPDSELSTRTLNVLICHKTSATTEPLNWENVQQHIVATNNSWYQTINPLLSNERREQLAVSFADCESKSLSECYLLLFTEAEREHLEYEHFLQDWDAYREDHAIAQENGMSLTTALDFLQEMQ